MAMVPIGFGFTVDRSMLNSILFAELSDRLDMEDIHTIHLHPWDVVSPGVVVIVAAAALGARAHPVLVVFYQVDHWQLP